MIFLCCVVAVDFSAMQSEVCLIRRDASPPILSGIMQRVTEIRYHPRSLSSLLSLTTRQLVLGGRLEGVCYVAQGTP